ncbi:MAG: HEAT repeat domain-containing protein [Nitrospirota bacterium]
MAALSDKAVQAEAAEALGAIRHENALAPLVRLLAAEASLVRWSAAEALGRTGHPLAVPPLVGALVDPEECVRGAVASALDRLGWQAPDAAARARFALAKKRWDDAVECGASAVPEAARLLQDGDAAVRAKAALVLGRLGSVDALERLALRLRDGDATVRASAADAMGRIADSWAVAPLIGALEDLAPAVRQAAAAALTRIGPAAVHPLVVAFQKRRALREVVELLASLVETCAASLAEDDLRTIASLRGADKVAIGASGQGPSAGEWSVRYLSIRQVARRELVRRGVCAA